MNQRQNGRIRFCESLAGIAELSGFSLTSRIIDLYLRSIEPHGLDAGANAIAKLAMKAKPGKGFPSIEDILNIVAPELTAIVSPEDEAVDAATRIIGAIQKYGHVDADRSRGYIGELGWQVVERNGGWNSVCETLTYANMRTTQAQYRDEAASIGRRSAARLDGPPKLPGSFGRSTARQVEAPADDVIENQQVRNLVAELLAAKPVANKDLDEVW